MPPAARLGGWRRPRQLAAPARSAAAAAASRRPARAAGCCPPWCAAGRWAAVRGSSVKGGSEERKWEGGENLTRQLGMTDVFRRPLELPPPPAGAAPAAGSRSGTPAAGAAQWRRGCGAGTRVHAGRRSKWRSDGAPTRRPQPLPPSPGSCLRHIFQWNTLPHAPTLLHGVPFVNAAFRGHPCRRSGRALAGRPPPATRVRRCREGIVHNYDRAREAAMAGRRGGTM